MFGELRKKPELPIDRLTIKTTTMDSSDKSIEDAKDSQEYVETLLSNKSVRDVICIYMNMQEGDGKHHRFIYAKGLEAENESSDCVSKLASTAGKIKKRKVGGKIMATTASESKPTAASELVFTFCFRSVRCDAYKFLDREVAERLVRLAKTLWNPSVLVNGDLKCREEMEERDRRNTSKPIFSEAIGNEELRMSSCEGFGDQI